jgi:hypothetical protein
MAGSEATVPRTEDTRPFHRENIPAVAPAGADLSNRQLPASRYGDDKTTRSILPQLEITGLDAPVMVARARETLAPARVGEQPAPAFKADKADSKPAAAEPSTEKAREAVHGSIVRAAETLVSDLNCSNKLGEQIPRALAESTLRVLSVGVWDGTGITQHKNWQKDIAARSAIVNPSIDAGGTVQIGPKEWEKCFDEVQGHRDQLNRKWANCSEQAASLAHIIYCGINNPGDKSMAGLKVRQAYGPGHSWTEVQTPNGDVTVYDPWKRLTGKREDMPASYRDNVHYTKWFGASPR